MTIGLDLCAMRDVITRVGFHSGHVEGASGHMAMIGDTSKKTSNNSEIPRYQNGIRPT
jgi:hypothetical protein